MPSWRAAGAPPRPPGTRRSRERRSSRPGSANERSPPRTGIGEDSTAPPSRRTSRTAPSVPVAGAMTANSDWPRRPIASEERPTCRNSSADLVRHALDFLLGWLFGGGSASASGAEHDAGQRVAPPERIRADLVGAPRQTAHVVQTGARIEQALLAQGVDLALALEEGGELEQQSLAVQRLAQELPRPGAVGLEALGAAGGARGRDDDGSGGAEARIAAQRAADLEAVHVRHLGVEDDEVGLGGPGPLERLLAGVGPNHGVAVRARGCSRVSGPTIPDRWRSGRAARTEPCLD